MLYVCCLCLLPAMLRAQDERTYTRQGNELYQQKKYKEAEAKYAQALGLKQDFLAAYINKGIALYQQDSLTDAAKQFELAASLTEDKNLKAAAYYNLGNAYLKEGKYEESIEAYKNALRNNPNDADARYNLAYAQSKLKNQPPQDQDQKDQNEDKEKDKNKDKQSGKNEDKQEQKDDMKDEPGQKSENPKDPKQGNKGNPDDAQKPKDDQQNEKEMQPKEGQMSKADVDRLLKALENEEKRLQERLYREDPKQDNTIEKDW